MKTKLVHVLSALMALVVLLSIPSMASDKIESVCTAVNQAVTTAQSETEDPTEPTEEPTEPTEPEESELDFNTIPGDTVVGRMYICTQAVGLGHAWIYIESDFNGDMPVGCYTLKSYQGVSMGTFAFSRSDGPGLYYNIESYCANEWGLKKQSWLGMDITKDQLVKVSNRIKQWNYWDLYFNCAFFATEIWNCVSSKKMIPILFPFIIKWQVLMHGGNRDVVLKEVDRNDCYKQKGVAGNVHIELVSDGSLDSKLM